MEPVRQWRATCGQLILVLPTEESENYVIVGPCSTVQAADGTTLTGDSGPMGWLLRRIVSYGKPDRESPGDAVAV